jgi:hypothetical protein
MRIVWPYIAGFGTAFIALFVLEAMLHIAFAMPAPASDPAALDRAMRALPTAPFVGLLISYAIASLAGGLTAALAADGRSSRPSIATGLALTVAGAANVYAMYHPAWFRIASLLIYLPFSYLGCLAARGRKARQ